MEFGWSPESDVIKSGAEGQSRTDTESPLPVLSLVRVVLIDVIRRDLLQPPGYSHSGVCA